MFRFLSTALDQTLWCLFVPNCPVCDQTSQCGGLCDVCQVVCPIVQKICCYCGEVTIDGGRLCISCVELTERKLEEIHSLLWLNEGARKIFHLIKYESRFEWLSVFISEIKNAKIIESFKGATLVPVPMSPKKFLERGFNQSEILAETLSQVWDLEVSDGLRKVSETLPQSHLNRRERLLNLKNCFVWDQKKPVPERVVLIDDIFTTGETLKRCGEALKAVGITQIYAWTLFRTRPSETK